MSNQKNNATCGICGKPYHICMSCRDSMQLQPWKTFTDTSEHYKVFQIVRGLSTGVYTKVEAKEKLKNVDLHDLSEFRPHIKAIIEEVLKETNVEPKESVIEEVAEQKVEQEGQGRHKVETANVVRRRSRRKVDNKPIEVNNESAI